MADRKDIKIGERKKSKKITKLRKIVKYEEEIDALCKIERKNHESKG